MKMDEESLKQLGKLNEEFYKLSDRMNVVESEMNQLFIDATGNFEGKYIKYYSDTEDLYVFMRVDRQAAHVNMHYYGPAIRITGDTHSFDVLTFEEDTVLVVPCHAWKEDVSDSYIEEIGEEEFKKVLGEYFKKIEGKIMD